MLYVFATEIKPLQLDLGNTSGRNETMPALFLIFSLTQSILTASNLTFGVVKNSFTNKPLEGVNITSGQQGTSTDKKGKFIIEAETGYLYISHVGFKSLEIRANDTVYVNLIRDIILSDEIVVISSLSEQSIFNTSSSIALLNEKEIKNHNFEHFQDVINHIPNLNFAGGTSRPRYFQIRGIGESSQFFGEGSPNHSVSYEIDGIDLSGIGMIGGMIDADQIQVARGPQSTIFGNNSIAGAINILSADPVRKNFIKLNYNTGNDNLRYAGFTANLKILRDSYFRFNFYKNYQDGFRKNKFLGKNNTNKKDETFFRLKINFPIKKNILLKNTVLLSEIDNGYDAWAPDNNKALITYSDQPGKDYQNTRAIASKLILKSRKYSAMIKYSSSSSNIIYSYDGDWGNNAFWEDSSTYNFDSNYYGYYLPYQYFDKTTRLKNNTNSEMRIYNKKALFGFYLKQLSEKDEGEGYLFGGEGNVSKASSDYDINVKAVFANLNSELSRTMSIANSFRHEMNEVSYFGQSFGYLNDTIPSIYANKIFRLNSFKSSFAYKLGSDSKLFAHISYGYKTGGVNQQPYVSYENRIYNPEYLGSYEISLKHSTEAIFINTTFFYNDRINQQISISAQQNINDPNSFYYYTTNSESEGFSRGIEIDLNAQISKKLSIKTALAYLDTWTSKFSYIIADNNVQFGGGREAAMAPKITASASMNYSFNSLSLSLSQSYKDEYYFSDNHNFKSGSYYLTNGSLGKFLGDFKISVWVKNIFDERYAVRGFYFGLIPPDYEDNLWLSYGEPKQYGVSIDYNFKE